MIFDNNTTKLGTSIPMAEGYNSNYGVALALVESAQNDYAMFKAMINTDFQEASMRREGTFNESAAMAFNEAVGVSLWNKIKELISKLVAKVKSIMHNFMAKINGLFMKDADLVKKYTRELNERSNQLDNLEVEWCMPKNEIRIGTVDNLEAFENVWAEDSETLEKNIASKFFSKLGLDTDDVKGSLTSYWLNDKDTVKLSQVGGIKTVCTDLQNAKKTMNDFDKKVSDTQKSLEKLVKEADNNSKKAKENKDKDKDSEEVTKASHVYDAVTKYQSMLLQVIGVAQKVETTIYKQNKAAFMKAVTASDKKLEQSEIYLNAVAEEAEEEVEDVIAGAIEDDSDLADISAATVDVKDDDVSDCPEANNYDKVQKYSTDADTGAGTEDGEIDVTVNSREEAALFSGMLY